MDSKSNKMLNNTKSLIYYYNSFMWATSIEYKNMNIKEVPDFIGIHENNLMPVFRFV